MEIERKYKIELCPDHLDRYKSQRIKQGYVSISPVVRIRHSNEAYILTIKGKGLISREEFELTINKEEFDHLATKLDYPMLSKTRYLIPLDPYVIELDVFHDHLTGLILAEVEFPSIEEANAFIPPDWFGEDVSLTGQYQNSRLCQLTKLSDI